MVRNIIKQSLFFIVFSLGILFFFPISAKASTTGFPDDWDYTITEDSIILNDYLGWSNTVIIEGPIEYEGKTYKVYWNGNVYASDIRTRGRVYVNPEQDLKFSNNRVETMDLRYLDTSEIRDMSSMFGWCHNLRTLYFGEYFDTSNVTNMSNMFAYCENLTSLDVSSFNTSNVTDMDHMFACCASLKTLDLRNFDTRSVNDMDQMFFMCNNLETVDLSSFEVEYPIDGWGMFNGCLSLKSLNLSGFDLKGSDNYVIFFGYDGGLNSLRTIITPRNTMYFILPCVQIKENEDWIDYPTIWKDSSGKQYRWRYPGGSEVAVQSTMLTYVGIDSEGEKHDGYQPPDWIVEGSGYTPSNTLPNTDASDYRRIIMLIFLLSLACSLFSFKVYRK